MLKVLLLYPISLIYGLVVNIRNFMFDVKILKSTSFDIPIISVGNITVGGTGKTPHVEYVISFLKEEYNIAVLSRGYKRATKGFVLAQKDSNAKEIGDEPKQIKQKYPDITVAVCESRVKGVKKLLEIDNKLNLILLDDAFQHRYITPGLSILLIDYNRPFLKDHYLPYGRLRENPGQRHRADIMLVTKTPKHVKPIDMRIMSKTLNLFPYQSLYFTSFEYGKICPVFSKNSYLIDKDIIKKEKYSVLIVTGIAYPQTLIEYVKTLTTDFSVLRFPDHHYFKTKDIEKISAQFSQIESEKKIIITTEKDAMRFVEINIKDKKLKSRMVYVPIKPKILANDEDEFKDLIMKYLIKDKSDYILRVSERQY